MKDSHIYLFENIGCLDVIVGCANIKEKFVKNSFEDEVHILLYISEDLTSRKTVLLDKIKSNLVKNKEYSVQSFTQQFSSEIKSIYDYKKKNNLYLSWLEIFQLAIMVHDGEDSEKYIAESLNNLSEFKKIIFQKY